MNWDKLSEKLAKDKKGNYIIIFCDPADMTDPFITGKVEHYQAKNLNVVMKDPDEKRGW